MGFSWVYSDRMVQGHQALSLFEGVTEPNESRLSRMSEEEAAFLFETRYLVLDCD